MAALAARTEGWAAGLRLAALSLRGREDMAGFVAAFAGSHRYVLDYLTEEVLGRQGEEVRAFLLETSVLDRLSGPLCDAVTGRAGSQALLEQVEREGLFLLPLDEVRGWWRYHHLFADLLRACLQQEQPGYAAKLHGKAAAWYSGHGLSDDAIRHAVAADEMTWAARLIEQNFDEFYYLRGEAATIRRWLSALPADLVRSRPRLLLAQAFMATGRSDRVEEVEELVDAAERAPRPAASEPFEPSAGQAGSLLVNVQALIPLHRSYLAALRGDAEAAAAFASKALAETSEADRLADFARWNLAVAEWLRGRLAAAERGAASSLARWQAAGLLAVAAWNGYELARIQRAQARLDVVVLTCGRALDTAAVPGQPPALTAGPAYVGLAEVAYQRNELDTALQHVTKGIELCRRFAFSPPLAAGLVMLAWIRQAAGDPSGARDAIDEARHAAPGPAGLLNPVPAQRARLLLAQGDVAAAARWTRGNGLTPDDEPGYAREAELLVLARVLLAQDNSGTALALLDRLHAAAAAQERAGSLIEIGALQALALAASGQDEAAAAALTSALASGCPQGYVRVFADEGPPMAALVGKLISARRTGEAAEVPLDCLARLQRAFGTTQAGHGPRQGTAAVPGIVEPLTARELEVLVMLAAGRSNQAIASELVITVDTVKKHVSHVLDKLGAANRTQAAGRARQLGLIP